MYFTTVARADATTFRVLQIRLDCGECGYRNLAEFYLSDDKSSWLLVDGGPIFDSLEATVDARGRVSIPCRGKRCRRNYVLRAGTLTSRLNRAAQYGRQDLVLGVDLA